MNKTVWIHIKTQRKYTIIKIVRAAWDEKQLLVIYEDDTGSAWARSATEFYDGRFIQIDNPDTVS